MSIRTKPTLIILLCLLATPVCAVEPFVKIGGINVAVWAPETPATKSPVIIFSHGYHGCGTQSIFLMRAFAHAGYFVFAPNHHDAACAAKGLIIDPAMLIFSRPEEWNENTFNDRRDDIKNLIAALKKDARYRDRLDWDRLGLVGHSLGGYTMLALGGAWDNWKMPGAKAILALSPYTNPFLLHDTLRNIKVPVMYQAGSRDIAVTPFLISENGAYVQSSAPKYYVEFARAGHFAWTNIPSVEHDNIELYSLAFMDRYVKGQPADLILTQSPLGIASLRYESELGNSKNAPSSNN